MSINNQFDLFNEGSEIEPKQAIPMLPCLKGKAKATHEYTDEQGNKHYWHSYGRKPEWFDFPNTKQISKSWRFD